MLAVATGKGYPSATTLLTTHGIIDWFQSIETPTHNRGKPDPEMIHTAIAKAGVTVKDAVMVGDTVHDMHMARAAGVAAIGVAWGYHERVDLLEAGADIVIDGFDQLERPSTSCLDSRNAGFIEDAHQHRNDGVGRSRRATKSNCPSASIRRPASPRPRAASPSPSTASPPARPAAPRW